MEVVKKEKQSTLGILAFVLAISCLLAPAGLIVGIIDLAVKDKVVKENEKKSLSVAAVCIGTVVTILMGVGAFIFIRTVQNVNAIEAAQVNAIETAQVNAIETVQVNVGDSFIYDNLKITINSYNPDYEVDWYYQKKGMKYVRVGVTFENMSRSDSSYAQRSNFSLYADNVACEHDIGYSDCIISTKLGPGRKVSGGLYFLVPLDAESIELEYSEIFGDPVIIKLK